MNFIFSSRLLFKRSVYLTAFFILLTTLNSFATHLRAGEIIVESNGCGLTFTITVIAYTNTIGTTVLFGGDGTAILDFGDGKTISVPDVPHTPRPDLGEGVATASYTVAHTYSGYGKYTISYREPNRNEGVLNMSNSVETEFYVETTINIDPFYGCNNPPRLGVPPIDEGCTGVAWFHNPGAFDPDNRDSLAYELVVPFQDRNLAVNNYRSPASAGEWYPDFENGNEAQNDKAIFKINPRDGTITWDAPGATGIGEYNVAFIVKELRKIKGTWRELSRVRRDMQIIIRECSNKRPDLIVPKDTCVEAGTKLTDIEIIGTDYPDNDKVKIEAFSEILTQSIASPATFSGNDDDEFYPVPYKTLFNWQTDCSHVKEQPYQVVFKVKDNGSPSLATYKTWFIKVVGPAPRWKDATLIEPSRSVNLEWDNYKCLNAQTMQIWRRVDSVAFTPDNCETGMPALGYTLIAEVPIKNSNNDEVTTYTDKGLLAGAKYCYRLVAKYPLPKGGESYVSKDTCILPFETQAPIITNVTIDSTDVVAGQITVKWHKPLAIMPPNYFYKVYRGNGFSGSVSEVHTSTDESDTTFIDKGLNTQENVFHYKVISFEPNAPNPDIRLDSSGVASSVRLEAQSLIKKIELSWSADVPWSIQNKFYHVIYRGSVGSKGITDMVKIDSILSGSNSLMYLDDSLENDITYCYVVKTKGTYGNDKIKEPLKNFSQKLCTQTGDSIPPCKPTPPLASTLDCSNYKQCTDNDLYLNTIKWNRPDDPECRKDIVGYIIYSATSENGTYTELRRYKSSIKVGIIKDTIYVDSLLLSFARCYKIVSVDRSNNLSELSDAVCFDNCPYYELPNVFTPNGDNCNEKFSAYGVKINFQEEGNCPASDEDNAKCARFVESVICRVYNRWGKEVFGYKGKKSEEGNTIYINWDGRDKNGTELSPAVYYYIAEVTFDVVNPSQKVKIYKGWVHLVR